MSVNMPGWLGRDEALKARDQLEIPDYKDMIGKRDLNTTGKVMLYQFTRSVLGHDNPLYAQLIGDCTAASMKNCVSHLQCVEIAVNGKPFKWRPPFMPFYYGASRVWIGGGGFWGDGSTAAYTSAAAKKYGTLYADEQGVPTYTASVAKSWGKNAPPQSFEDQFAKNYLVTDYAKVNSAEEAADNLLSGRPITIASNYGFSYQPDSAGFNKYNTHWSHNLSLIGVDTSYKTPFFICENSWGGGIFGRLKDFDTGDLLPECTLRLHWEDVDGMCKADDTFALAGTQGFIDQSKQISEAMFNFI